MTWWFAARAGRTGPNISPDPSPPWSRISGRPRAVRLVVEVDAVDVGVLAGALGLGRPFGRGHGASSIERSTDFDPIRPRTGLIVGDASHRGRANQGAGWMDRALVEAARSGDEEAFASIARGSADRLFGIAHRILRDIGRAEDAVQQTLVTAWKELPGLRESERFDAWIDRILVHACYAEAKKRLPVVRQRRGPVDRRARDAGQLRWTSRRVTPSSAGSDGFRRSNARPSSSITTSAGRSARSPTRSACPSGTVKSRIRYATSTLRAGLEADARTETSASRERLA